MAQLFANNLTISLAAGLTAGQLGTVTVAVVSTAAMPTFASGDWMYMTLSERTESAWEIVKVTAYTANSVTFIRAQEGTGALNWTAGAALSNRAVASDIAAIQGKANLYSPAFLGNPKAPTPTKKDNSVSIATTEFVKQSGATYSQIIDVSADTVLTSDAAGAILSLSSPATFNITLPQLSTMRQGDTITVLHNNAASGVATVKVAGSDQIKSNASVKSSVGVTPAGVLTFVAYNTFWLVSSGFVKSTGYAGFTNIQSTDYTVTDDSLGNFFKYTAAAGGTITLPSPLNRAGATVTLFNKTAFNVSFITPAGGFDLFVNSSVATSFYVFPANTVSLVSDGVNWVVTDRQQLTTPAVLTVAPSGAMFASLDKAVIALASIASAPSVTITIADGVYSSSPSVDAKFPVTIVGNNASPTNCVINGSLTVKKGAEVSLSGISLNGTGSGILVDGGKLTFNYATRPVIMTGFVNGLMVLNGGGVYSVTASGLGEGTTFSNCGTSVIVSANSMANISGLMVTGRGSSSYIAVSANTGGTIVADNSKIQSATYGVFVAGNASFTAACCVITDVTTGFYAQHGGIIYANPSDSSQNAVPSSVTNATTGFFAEAGKIYAPYAVATSCTAAGFSATHTGSISAYKTAATSCTTGWSVDYCGTMSAYGSVPTGNTTNYAAGASSRIQGYN